MDSFPKQPISECHAEGDPAAQVTHIKTRYFADNNLLELILYWNGSLDETFYTVLPGLRQNRAFCDSF